MLESISSSDLEVGNSYVETYYTGYTLFTVIERTFINPTDIQYSVEDYYFSNGDRPSNGIYTCNDFSSNAIYPLPSDLTPDQVKDLYPELFI